MLVCIQLDIAFLELDEETYFTRKATVLHVRTMVSCRFPISLQSIHRMSYSMFSLNPIQSDQILYINLLRRRGFKWFQVASSLTWPRIRHRMARNSGDTRVRGMPAFRRARLWSSSQLCRGLFQFGRFRFVIGVPPVIIHFERWDFPWNKLSILGTSMTMDPPILTILNQSILMGLSLINQAFWWYSIDGNPHLREKQKSSVVQQLGTILCHCQDMGQFPKFGGWVINRLRGIPILGWMTPNIPNPRIYWTIPEYSMIYPAINLHVVG